MSSLYYLYGIILLGTYLIHHSVRPQDAPLGELVQVIGLMRHGSRGTYKDLSPPDYVQEPTVFPEGEGELTRYGKQEIIIQGHRTCQNYRESLKLNKTGPCKFPPSKIQLLATNISSRAQKTARAFFIGLTDYKDRSGASVIDVAGNQDDIGMNIRLLSHIVLAAASECSNIKQMVKKNIDKYKRFSPEEIENLTNMLKTPKLLINLIFSHVRSQIILGSADVADCYGYLLDRLNIKGDNCSDYHRYACPYLNADEKAKDIAFLESLNKQGKLNKSSNSELLGKTLNQMFVYGIFNNTDLQKKVIGTFFGRVDEIMDQQSETTVKAESQSIPIFQMYSAHDHTMAAVKTVLGVAYTVRPSYGSMLFMELWKRKSVGGSANYTVRIVQNSGIKNSSFSHVKTMDLDNFRATYKGIMVKGDAVNNIVCEGESGTKKILEGVAETIWAATPLGFIASWKSILGL